jgi:carboxyl-terminal processing protease
MVEYAEERASAITHRWRTFDSVAVWSMSAFGFQDRRIDEHLAQARRYPWLVLDLRGNPGGALEGVNRLLGHFTDTALVAYAQRFRDSTTADTVRPSTRPRGRYAGRVIVLVDSESASSSEIVAWTLQHTMGATVLGDRTAGQVRGSVVIRRAVRGDVRVLFGVQVSIFDVVMPDGTRLERLGVSPDRLVLPSASDLAEGRDPVLQAALALAAGN